MVQPKLDSVSKTFTPIVSIKWETRENNWLGKLTYKYRVIHLIFITFLISCLLDLLMNGDLGPTFLEVSKHFNDLGLKLESVVNCFLWISVVVLIMEATLHVNICLNLLRDTRNQQGLPLFVELAPGWFQLCLIFVFLEGLVLLRLCEFYISPQVLTLVMAHACSGFVVLSYIKLVQFAKQFQNTNRDFNDLTTRIAVISNM